MSERTGGRDILHPALAGTVHAWLWMVCRICACGVVAVDVGLADKLEMAAGLVSEELENAMAHGGERQRGGEGS